MPSLEPRECDQARDVVREFYSFHFGNELSFAPADLEPRKKWLTQRLLHDLGATAPAVDPFTLTDDRPKSFRAGECSVVEPERAVEFELLLLWKTDTRTEQRAIRVRAEKQDGQWLIDKIYE